MTGDSEKQVREPGLCLSLILELPDGLRIEFDFNQVLGFHFHHIHCPQNRVALFRDDGTLVSRAVFASWKDKMTTPRKTSEAE